MFRVLNAWRDYRVAWTYLSLDEVTYSYFGHDGNSYSINNLLDHLGVTLGYRLFSIIDIWKGGRGHTMRATPPWTRMSAGTRSKAMTAHACKT